MNNKDIDQSKDSSSPESSRDHKIPPKRQKLEGLIEVSCKLLKTKLESIGARIASTEATPSDIYQIRLETDEIFNQKKSVLRIQLRMNADGIEELRRKIELKMKKNNDLLLGMTFAESRLYQKISAIVRKVHALMFEAYQLRLRDSASKKSQDDGKDAREREVRAAEKGMAELHHRLKTIRIYQIEYDLENIELERMKHRALRLQTIEKRMFEWKSNSRSQNGSNCQERTPEGRKPNFEESELSPAESTSPNDSEEELRSSRSLISTLHGGVEVKILSEEQRLTLKKISDDAEEEEQVMRLEENFKELSSRLCHHQSSESETSSVVSKQKGSSPQQIEAHSLVKQENLNPDDNEFPWYVPNDECPPLQNIDVMRFEGDNEDEMGEESQSFEVGANMPAGTIGVVSDWLLTPEASSSGVSNEDSASNAPYEFSVDSTTETDDEDYSSSDSDVMEVEEKDPWEAFKMVVGKNVILVSDPRFFRIHWSDECRQIEGNQWACKKCPQVERWRPRIEDHVWIIHYRGTFKCPYCPFNSEKNQYKTRCFSTGHLKARHAQLFEEIEPKSKKKAPSL